MSQKPAGLILDGVDDMLPTLGVVRLLAVQHIFLMSSTLVLPVVLVTELGGDFSQVQSVVALTMVACGVGTILPGDALAVGHRFRLSLSKSLRP